MLLYDVVTLDYSHCDIIITTCPVWCSLPPVLLWIKYNLSYCECRTFMLSEFGLAYQIFMIFVSGRLSEWTLSKFFCFLSNAAQAAFNLSMSIMRSSTSPCSLCFVFSSEAHFELTASVCSSESCSRWASFFLQDKTISTERRKILTFWENGQERSVA